MAITILFGNASYTTMAESESWILQIVTETPDFDLRWLLGLICSNPIQTDPIRSNPLCVYLI